MFENKGMEKPLASVGALPGNSVFPLQYAGSRPHKTKSVSDVPMADRKRHNDRRRTGHMVITSLLRQVDPLIQAIAGSYRNVIFSYDHDDLVQEGRLVVLEALRRYFTKQVEINPASISSWVYIAVSSRFKELASNGSGIVSCAPFDEVNWGDNGDRTGSGPPHEDSSRHVRHVCRLTQNHVVTPLLKDLLTTRDAAVQIERTTQRVTQLQKEFIKDWEDALETNGGRKWKRRE